MVRGPRTLPPHCSAILKVLPIFISLKIARTRSSLRRRTKGKRWPAPFLLKAQLGVEHITFVRIPLARTCSHNHIQLQGKLGNVPSESSYYYRIRKKRKWGRKGEQQRQTGRSKEQPLPYFLCVAGTVLGTGDRNE